MFSKNSLNETTRSVYEYLYGEIVNNRLPPGTALSELEISRGRDISRTPVREALMVLEGEGLVRRYPGRGCFVSDISKQDVNEIFFLRSLLEVAALRQSFSLLDVYSLRVLQQDLLALTPESPPEEYFDTDRRLHNLFVGACGNMRLIQILRTLNGQIEQFRKISSRLPQRLKNSRHEHLELVQTIIDGDLERVCTLLEEHIRNIQMSTLMVCAQMGIKDIYADGEVAAPMRAQLTRDTFHGTLFYPD